MSVGPIFAILGGLLLVIGLFFFMRIRRFLASAKEVKGTVIQMAYRSSSDSGGGYAAVYQFRTLDGKTIVAQDSLTTNPPRHKVGQELDVLYDPEDPNRAYIKSFMSLYFLPALLGGLGVVFGGVGGGLALPQVLKALGL
jgi:hypothetical protein